MLIRSAYWTGRPREGHEVRFRDMVTSELAPAMRSFPGVGAVKVLWPDEREDGAPMIYCQVLVEFADAAAKVAMMTCAKRAALRPRVLEAAELFDGSLAHIDFEVA